MLPHQMFPPKPQYTEKDLPDLSGKVYIVTGSNTGIGKELSRILYSKNATAYLAARSEAKANAAIDDIKKSHPGSEGSLVFFHLDLNDLSTIRASAERFLSMESRLDVLFNNAGIQNFVENPYPKTAQGYECHLGVNCLGTFLFTKLLTPMLVATAQKESSPPGSVRVVWVSSSATELGGTKSTGIDMDNLDYHVEKPYMDRYCMSKAGNWLHGVEFARRYEADKVVSVPLNPGNTSSDLFRGNTDFIIRFAGIVLAYPVINGAYTELYAGLSPDITLEKTGSWVVPFGRIFPIRNDLLEATKPKDEGGNGTAARFWEWSEEQVKPYA
ncbi:putative short-chain dehydrogenase [Xylariomycetidae sp. FL0641]|nr:putative short-chain dehydrogenase [Xylariomycetidae sp. FL0641]